MEVWLIHGKAGSPDGTSLHLEEVLRQHLPGARFTRPLLPHSDPSVPAEQSLVSLRELDIPRGAYVIGVSLGGLLAARLQEHGREDLSVLALSSPTWADEVHLVQKPANRAALYSSSDDVLGGGTPHNRTVDWPRLADARDLPWLSHDTKAHKHRLQPLLLQWLTGRPIHESSAEASAGGIESGG